MRILPALITLSLLLPAAAMAQGRMGANNPAMRPPEAPRAQERPAGLPGLTARPSQVIPPTTIPSSMNPNDALFDAISRGDVPTAREAVARGADTNARNALGLTAVDSAVDQGRPDMIFYLLSLRGTAGSTPAPEGNTPPPPARNRAAQREPRPSPTAPAATAPVRDPAPARTARLFANDGGAAQPQMGFLGFDAGRAAGATASHPHESRSRGEARRQRAPG
jgi:hypothetical protein